MQAQLRHWIFSVPVMPALAIITRSCVYYMTCLYPSSVDQGSALLRCFVMRSITIPVLRPFVHNIGQKATLLPFPLSCTSCSVLPCWLHSVLCTCHSDRDSVSVGCSVKQNGLGADQITASMLFNRYLQVMLCAFDSCCV